MNLLMSVRGIGCPVHASQRLMYKTHDSKENKIKYSIKSKVSG